MALKSKTSKELIPKHHSYLQSLIAAEISLSQINRMTEYHNGKFNSSALQVGDAGYA